MFSQFALHERLLKAVAELKFVEPTPVQVAAIPLALQGRDLRVTAQTGSGKTAAFVLPILNRLMGPAKVRVDIRAVILLPTRELAQQTLKEVERFSQFTFIKAGLITGGEDFKVQAAMLRKVPDILIGTPGRLLEQLNAGNLDLKNVEVLVLDEADRMLDMGFSEDVTRLSQECAQREQTLLFSATTGGAGLREMIGKVLKDPEHLLINNVSQLAEGTRQQICRVPSQRNVPQGADPRLRCWPIGDVPESAVVFAQHPKHGGRPYLRSAACAKSGSQPTFDPARRQGRRKTASWPSTALEGFRSRRVHDAGGDRRRRARPRRRRHHASGLQLRPADRSRR